MKSINLAEIKEAGESNRLTAGGYVCKYTNVSDVSDKEYLYMEFDIAEGQFKDYYKKLEEQHGFWAGKCYRSYKETALPMFKRMCSAVSKSNTGFIFDGGTQNSDEKTLVGKLVGMVLGEEEYIKNNGEIGTKLYVKYECDVDKIRKGNFTVPAKKKLAEESDASKITADFMKIADSDDEECPFFNDSDN